MRIDPRRFRSLDREARLTLLEREGILTAEEVARLRQEVAVLPLAVAEQMIENVVGVHPLPLGIVPAVPVDGRLYDVPMVIEEPSVVAAQANAAKLARAAGGYRTGADEPIMIGQVQLVGLCDPEVARARILERRAELLAAIDAATPGLVRRGGGARGLEARLLRHPEAPGPMLVVHFFLDVRDAMGANAVNTAAEALAPRLEVLTGGRVVLRILSNYADRRTAWAELRLPIELLAKGDHDGHSVAEGIVWASYLAEVDPYRAATHNKGIMNGIDAVLLATGNDWRAVEAGAHAWAARNSGYGALATWRIEGEELVGRLELPLAVGIVGGQTRTHPLVGINLRLLGVASATELARIVAAVGLGQNLSALRALASTGIQAGHMAMHARALALEVGARPEEVPLVAAELRRRGRIDRATAEAVLRELRAKVEER